MSKQIEHTGSGNEFDYLLGKIQSAKFENEPFKHLEITNFLKEKHFTHITELDTITTSGENDRELINSIKENGYEQVSFPGTFNTVEDYISHRNGTAQNEDFDTIENKGIVFRLSEYNDPLLEDLFGLFNSKKFLKCVTDKFGLSQEEFEVSNSDFKREAEGLDLGIQKYLDGYEISPHPDIRKKALTWMLNLNPNNKSKEMNHHTHYLELKDAKKYIKEYWKHNTSQDRCWLPWEWCHTRKRQVENNTIVLFSPSFDTLHGVKTDYDHLETQRTQLYGNLWYENVEIEGKPEWDDFLISAEQ